MARERDYKAEYARRLAQGRAAGKTRQQARGHPRGEGKLVRSRPATPQMKQEARKRGAILKRNRSILKQGTKDPSAGLIDRKTGKPVKPFKRSLLNARAGNKTGTVVFTFEGVPNEEEVSPKLQDQAKQDRIVFQAVPIRFDQKRPPIPLRVALLELDDWIERARAKTSLIDPELVDIYVVKRTIVEIS